MSQDMAVIAAAQSPTRFTAFDLVVTYADTVRRVVFTPAAFFRQPTPTRRDTPAVPFAAASLGISAVLGQALALAAAETAADQLVPVIVYEVVAGGLALGAGAVLLHLLIRAMVRPHAGFRVTLGLLAYCQVGVLVAWAPGPIGLVAPLATLALATVGVREQHGTTTRRAAVVVLLAAAGLTVLSMLVVVAGLFLDRACCGVAGG